MKKRSVFLLLAFLLLAGIIGSHPAMSVQDENPKRVLILYEGPDLDINMAKNESLQLAELLGHFEAQYVLKPANLYRRGEVESYSTVFFIGTLKNYEIPTVLLEDIYTTKKAVCWIDNHLEQIRRIGSEERWGFRLLGHSVKEEFIRIVYHDTTLVKGDPVLNLVQISGKTCTTVATALSKAREVPYIVRSGDFWYIADNPFSFIAANDRFLALCDLLHDILGEQHSPSRSAMIRIEDVNVTSDPDSIREIANFLKEQDVPFLISLVPIFRDPETDFVAGLSSRPNLVRALRYAVEKGGSIVMHGVTHQYSGRTASDFEFWDGVGEKPIRNDSAAWVSKRLRIGLSELFSCGLYPILWETPHYAASTTDYKVFANFFSSATERKIFLNDFEQGILFPFIIRRDIFGMRIYPENLGYIPYAIKENQETHQQEEDVEAEMNSINEILRNLRAQRVVRDSFSGVFFHPFVNISVLRELIRRMKEENVSFVDLRSFPHWVKAGNKAVLVGSDEASISLDNEYLHEVWLNDRGLVQKDHFSFRPMKRIITRMVQLPTRWLYAAEGVTKKPVSSLGKIFSNALRLFRKPEGLPGKKAALESIQGAIIWNPVAKDMFLRDQESFSAVFKSISVALEKIPFKKIQSIQEKELRVYSLILVPAASAVALSEKDRGKLVDYVRGGGRLITDTGTPLSEALGIEPLKENIQVRSLQDIGDLDQRIVWKKSLPMNCFSSPAFSLALCVEAGSKAPVMVTCPLGHGRFIYLGTFFDPWRRDGLSCYPQLLNYLPKVLRLAPPLKRNAISVYFDPGYRQTVSIEKLARRWKEDGVSSVYVGGWHLYPSYRYDYRRLIRVCHALGIGVYLWLEFPYVTRMFWDEHPEWREKTAAGKDAQVDWRSLMALEDPSCRKAVWEWLGLFLKEYEWDGVNIAELCFNANPEGPNDPEHFTPFHPAARNLFEKKWGFDPVDLFKEGSPHFWKKSPGEWQNFVDFRVELNLSITEDLLKFIASLKETPQKKNLEVLLTVFDSTELKSLRENLGVDTPLVIPLCRKYGSLLQVEDPGVLWANPPERYLRLGDRYRPLLGNLPWMIDINVLPVRKAGQTLPTDQATGSELYQLIHNAAISSSSVGLYSEFSIRDVDKPFLPSALVREGKLKREEKGWLVESPTTIWFTPYKIIETVSVDGKRWPCWGEEDIILPPGRHRVDLTPSLVSQLIGETMELRILDLTGELISAQVVPMGLEAVYESTRNCYLTLDREPQKILLDGQNFNFTAELSEKGYVLTLPPGRHTVIILAESRSVHDVRLTGMVSSNIIVHFGLAGCILLFALYLASRITRRKA